MCAAFCHLKDGEMMKYYLAIDVGTTNWKASVFDEAGTMLAIERTPTVTHTEAAGRYYDPIEMWDSVRKLCAAVTARVGVPISGVSVTSVSEAIVGIARNGQPSGNIITWFDTRSMKQAMRMREAFGQEKLYRITGLDVNPIFSVFKIMWIRENRPAAYEKTVKWLSIGDYILYRLTGEFATDCTLACRTMAFDICSNTWSREILDWAQIPEDRFPPIYNSGAVIGTVSEATAQATGITRGAKVAVGGNDHPCGSIAAGVIRGDKILDSSGTAESFLYISQKDAVPNMEFRGQRTCRYLQKERYVLWGGIICSGRSFDWATETFRLPEGMRSTEGKLNYKELLDTAAKVKGIEDGLIYYPHLRGAGAPHWDPRVSGSLLGLRDTHTSLNVIRAVLEGLSMQARRIIETEEAVAGVKVNSVCVVGGSSKNLLWQQIKANVLQKDVELCHEPEATSLGAAMLAAIGDGTYDSIEQVSDILACRNQVVHPEVGHNYEEAYQLFCDGYDQLKEMNYRLYELGAK